MSLFSQKEIQLIQQQAGDAEKTRRLSPEVLDILYRNKLLKLFVPKELGGAGAPLPNALKIFEECAFVDGTIGWLAAIGSGGNYFAGYYSQEVAARLFSPANAVLAGSGYSGLAKKTDGGYTVTGSWKYCSGAGFATFFTASAQDENGNIKAYTFMPEQVTVTEDWNAFGLKATESNTISVHDAFVPNELVFDLSKPPISFPNEKVFSFPFLLFAQLSFAAVVLGLSSALVNEAVLQQVRFNNDSPRAVFVSTLLQAEKATLRTLANKFYDAAQKGWEVHTGNNPLDAALMDACEGIVLHISQNASALAAKLLPHAGMEILMERTALNRIYRNLLTANQHVLLRKY